MDMKGVRGQYGGKQSGKKDGDGGSEEMGSGIEEGEEGRNNERETGKEKRCV